MTPEQRQRLAVISCRHNSDCNCDNCFLLSLLDQAQRDTERVDGWRHWIAEIYTSRDDKGVCVGSELTISVDLEPFDGPTRTIREAMDKALDQAALAKKGKNEK